MQRPTTTRVAHGPLGPAELAEAVVLADVSLALTVVGQVVPFGGALLAAAIVPLAVVAARHRLRAVVTGALAASAVGFLVIGTAAFTSMGACAALGALVGAADRRGWSRRRTMILGMAILGPIAALLSDGTLFAFSNLRKLTLDQVRNGWRGLFHLLRNLGLARLAGPGDTVHRVGRTRLVAEHPVHGLRAVVVRDLARAGPLGPRAPTRAQRVR